MTLPNMPQWAPEANYPAGSDPWSGTATKVPPPYDFITPGVPVAAQELNALFNQMTLAIRSAPASAINSWGTATATSSVVSGAAFIHCLAWDPINALWVAAAHTADGYAISTDDGEIWLTLGTLPGNPLAAIPLVNGAALPVPNGGGVSFILSGTTNIQKADYSGTVTDAGTHLGTTSTDGAVGVTHVPSDQANGFLYDGTNHRFRSYLTLNGTTITDNSAALPATWYNGPIVATYFTAGLGPVADFLVAAGGTTPSTNQSYILHATYDGTNINYANLTLPSAVFGKSIIGVAYNSGTAQWGAMCWDGTSSFLYVSSDLVSWTLQFTFPSFFASGLVSVGPNWVTTFPQHLHGNTFYRAIASLDGLTWKPLGVPFDSSLVSGVLMAPGDGNLGLFSTAGAVLSRRAG